MARSSSSAPLRIACTMLVSRYWDQLSVGAQVSAVRVMCSMSRHARYMYRCSGIGGLGLRPRGTMVKFMWRDFRSCEITPATALPRLGCDPVFKGKPRRADATGHFHRALTESRRE